jgi:acyl-CoA dehydrogenase
MDSDDFAEVLREVRRFVRDEVVPAEATIEDEDQIPTRIRTQAASMGLFGFALPPEHGGLGLSASEEARLNFEFGYTTPAFRAMFGTNNGIAGQVLVLAGTEEQKQRILPGLASGELVASFALTEPEAGSDPSALATTGRADGDAWILSGLKRFITNAPTADLFMVFARTSKGESGTDGISVFTVDGNATGLSVGPRDHKMGQRGAWIADVHLDDVRVPAVALVGQEGTGWRTAMACLSHGRLQIAALCVGMAQRLVDESVNWALDRRQGGRPIADHQLIQAKLADSQTEMMAARAMVLAAAEDFDQGTDRKLAPAAAKYFASEVVGRIADHAVQIHGGSGYIRGVPVERMYRDARLFRIYEGTSEIQQLVIARHMLRARTNARTTVGSI